MLSNLNRTILVTGHYGSGKTNFSLNLAVDLRRQGREVVLADLDIVNPFFRTAEFTDLAEREGITLVASDFAGPRTSIDIPALTGRLDARIGANNGATLIIDVGGDDVGATTLGRYANRLPETGYSMLYVVSAYRYLMRDPAESLALLREIESASRLSATHIVNNSNLGIETTAAEIRAGVAYAEKASALTGLPILCTTARRELADELRELQDLYPVDLYVTAPWN
jgi:energy-coupling factor transporter ATP-binding protein EcfA2